MNKFFKIAKYVGFFVFLALGITVGLSQIFHPALDSLGHYTLMMLIITVGLWIFKPLDLPFSASGGLFMAALLTFGVPSANVFSGFSGAAVWALIPALFFGFVLVKTGLGRRIACFGMKSIDITYTSLLMMWGVIGVVLSMLTPAIVVRVVIMTPIAMQCVQLCKLPEGSKARSLILITAWAMAAIPGLGWLTGSLTGPTLSGLYASTPELDGIIDFASWARVSLPPIAILTVLTVVGGYIALSPSEKLNISKEVFVEEYQKLGPMSLHEKIAGIVLISCFMLFATSSLHQIPDAAVGLFGLFMLIAAGIIESKEMSSGINWDMILFTGTAMGFGSVFAVTGISSWISDILVGALAPIAGNPWVFIFTILPIMFLWRFLDIAVFIPTMAIVSAIAPEVYSRYNINPLIWIPLLCIAKTSFFLSYTNMFILVAEANMNGKGWTAEHLAKYGVVYFIASMITMLAAVPYWISIGMFG